MGILRVKPKLARKISLGLIVLAAATLGLSTLGVVPTHWVEAVYSRSIYPQISSAMGFVAESVAFSWIDIVLPVFVAGLGYLVYRRKILQVLGLVSAAYLLFFWTWGLNYYRQPLWLKLGVAVEEPDPAEVDALALETATALNDLYPLRLDSYSDERALDLQAGRNVRRVVDELDGSSWMAATTVKSSRLLDPFFQAAGVDGMFNPFGHEAVVTLGLLPFERPMVVMHEAAHVRGYTGEGDANFVALMAGVNSSDPALRYSAWLALWLYLRSPELDLLLDDGPQQDVEAIFRRAARNRIEWIRRAQTRSLDLFLKAHDVEAGVRSYAEIVTLAAATRSSWDRFH